MARTAATARGSFTIRRRGRGGVFYVRFRHAGARVEESTGSSDEGEAARRAGEIFARYVTGKRRAAQISPRIPLEDLVVTWLCELRSVVSDRTIGLYASHMRAHIIPYFERLDRVTGATLASYMRERLRHVLKTTVRAELTTMKSFLMWAHEQGPLVSFPDWPKIPRRAVGVRNPNRRAGSTEVTAAEVERWLTCLPEMSTGKAGRHEAFPVRDRFIFAWETGLRPATIDALRVPEHWQPGQTMLTITDDIDKARFGRPVPLSPRALEVLARRAPTKGHIFGRRDCRPYVRAATIAADMPRGFQPYDLRHGRATLLTEASGNLPGVAYLLGHKQVTTTAIYVKPTRRAAEAALAAGARVGGTAPVESEISGEQAANDSQLSSASEKSDRKNADVLGVGLDDEPLETAGFGLGAEEPGGSAPMELKGLARCLPHLWAESALYDWLAAVEAGEASA